MGKKKVTLEEIFGKAIDEEMMHGTAFAEVGMAKVLANLAKKHFKEKALKAVGDAYERVCHLIDEKYEYDRFEKTNVIDITNALTDLEDEIRKRIKERFK